MGYRLSINVLNKCKLQSIKQICAKLQYNIICYFCAGTVIVKNMQINGRAEDPGRTISLTLLDNYAHWVILEPLRQRLFLNSTGRVLDRDVSMDLGLDTVVSRGKGFYI